MKAIASRLSLIFLFGTCLFADDLQWGGTWSGVWSGFGTSPYTAVDKSQNNKVLVIFCLDYNDEIAPPLEWLANIRPVTQDNVRDYAQFGGNYGHGITTTPWAFNGDAGVNAGHAVDLSPSSSGYTLSQSAYNRYLEAAWLFTNMQASLTNNDINSVVVSQVAAWDLFVEAGFNANDLKNRIAGTNSANSLYTFNNYAAPAASITNLLFQDAVDEALKAAQNAVLNQNWYASASASSWSLVTGDPAWTTAYGRPVQEFLTQTPSVPEPSSIFLFGTVILATIMGIRRKLRRS